MSKTNGSLCFAIATLAMAASGDAQDRRTSYRIPSLDAVCVADTGSPLSPQAVRAMRIIQLATELGSAEASDVMQSIDAQASSPIFVGQTADQQYFSSLRQRARLGTSRPTLQQARQSAAQRAELDSAISEHENHARRSISVWIDETRRRARQALAESRPRAALDLARRAYCLQPDVEAILLIFQSLSAAGMQGDLVARIDEVTPAATARDPLGRAIRRQRAATAQGTCGDIPRSLRAEIASYLPPESTTGRDDLATFYCWSGLDAARSWLDAAEPADAARQYAEVRERWLRTATEADTRLAQDDVRAAAELVRHLAEELGDPRIARLAIILARAAGEGRDESEATSAFARQVGQLQARLASSCAPGAGMIDAAIAAPSAPSACSAIADLPLPPPTQDCPARMARAEPSDPCCPETMAWNGSQCVPTNPETACPPDMWQPVPGWCDCRPGTRPGTGTSGTCCWPGQVASRDRLCRNAASSCLPDFRLVGGQCIYEPEELQVLAAACETGSAAGAITRYQACEIVAGWHRAQHHDQNVAAWRILRSLEARGCEFFAPEAASGPEREEGLRRLASLCIAAADSYAADDRVRAQNLLFFAMRQGASRVVFRMIALEDARAATQVQSACLTGDLTSPWAARVCYQRARQLRRTDPQRDQILARICAARGALPEDLSARRQACAARAQALDARRESAAADQAWYQALVSAPATADGLTDDQIRDNVATTASPASRCGLLDALEQGSSSLPEWSDWRTYRCVNPRLLGVEPSQCFARGVYAPRSGEGCAGETLCCPLRR